MALRLVRQTSETPNITNKDDVRMVRYAYGGYNGIVKSFGSECGYTAENGIFKVLDGRIVIDGWEIDIDGAGWSLNLSNVSGTQYHSVYAEINVATESVKLDSTYLSGSYPTIEKGDDLTQAPNGTARLWLYNVKVENRTITEVIKKFEVIRHIKERLEELGFKSGVATIESTNWVLNDIGGSITNTLKKQGKYCILDINIRPKTTASGSQVQLTVPKEFEAKEPTMCYASALYVAIDIFNGTSKSVNVALRCYISGNTITIYYDSAESDYEFGALSSIKVYSFGWEIK